MGLNQVKAYARMSWNYRIHQVYLRNGSMIEVFADGKKDAKHQAEQQGHKVAFVTCMIGGN